MPRKAKAPEPAKLLTADECRPRKRKPRYVYRSSINGFFVTAKYAARHPKTTVRERV